MLEAEDPKKIIPFGFNASHPRRDYYQDLAFEPAKDITVGKMLACAKEGLKKTFTGYKGGQYQMDKYTRVWLAKYGDYGEILESTLLHHMLYTIC